MDRLRVTTGLELRRETIALAVLLGAILAIAVLPRAFVGEMLSGGALHALAFGVLALGMSVAWPKTNPLALFAGLAAFGGAIELFQGVFASGRTADWNDWAVDCVAAALALIAFHAARAYFRSPNLGENGRRAREVSELRALIRELESGA